MNSAQSARLREALLEAERYVSAAIAGHGLAEDAPHLFSRGEVADLEAAVTVMRAALGPSETPNPDACGRLLVGQGTDTWDPVCTLAPGHAGRCLPDPAAPDQKQNPEEDNDG